MLGGDCTLLIGVLAGVQGCLGAGERLGLVMLDGQRDAYDGRTSPSGECADMDLTIALGGGPAELGGLGATAPPRCRRDQPGGGAGRQLPRAGRAHQRPGRLLLGPLGRSPALCGASVSDLNADRDPHGDCARLLARLIAQALA